MDIDFMEYDKDGNPVMLVELKLGKVGDIDFNDPGFTALCKLAAPHKIPVMLVVYYPLTKDGEMITDGYSVPAHIQFITLGVNEAGLILVPRRTRMTELDYVRLLHKVRGMAEPDPLKLCNTWREVHLPFIMSRINNPQRY